MSAIGVRFGEVHSVVAHLCDRWPHGFFVSDIVDASYLPSDVVEQCIYDFVRTGMARRTRHNLIILK